MLSKYEDLKQDAEEARDLLLSATRRRVKDFLAVELSKLEEELKNCEKEIERTSIPPKETENDTTITSPTSKTISQSLPKSYNVSLRNYSWDQSDKFLKLYLSLPNVHTIDKESINVSYTKRGLNLLVPNLDGKNYEFMINNFAYDIAPSKSSLKVKSDKIVLLCSKSYQPQQWEAVTAQEKAALDAKKTKTPDPNSEDPSAGIMSLMQQMYKDGDDNMKRMLNKTWYESQHKMGAGACEMDTPSLDDL